MEGVSCMKCRRPNWEENAFDRNLWIVDVATGESHALTSAKKSSTNAAWSSMENGCVSFRPPRTNQDTPEGKKQLYVISADGGEAQQLKQDRKRRERFRLGADSKRIAFSMTDPDPKTAQGP